MIAMEKFAIGSVIPRDCASQEPGKFVFDRGIQAAFSLLSQKFACQ
jgi:hypothetical protein